MFIRLTIDKLFVIGFGIETRTTTSVNQQIWLLLIKVIHILISVNA